MVRSAYGGSFAAASAPFKGRRRRAPNFVAQGARFCYVCVHRFGGAETQREQHTPSDIRSKLRLMGAVFVDTEAPAEWTNEHGVTCRPDWVWADWYAIAVPPEGIGAVEKLCKAVRISDGPYWGAGREGQAVGAGDKGAAFRKTATARRAALRSVLVRGNSALLCLELFGDRFAPVHLAPVPMAENAADLMPDEWQWGAAGWKKLVKEWPDFPRAYFVATMLYQCAALDTSAAVRLENWIRARVEKVKEAPPETATQREERLTKSKARALALGRTEAEWQAHEQGQALALLKMRQRPRLALSAVCAYYNIALGIRRNPDTDPYRRAAAAQTAARLKGILREGAASWKRSGASRAALPSWECAI